MNSSKNNISSTIMNSSKNNISSTITNSTKNSTITNIINKPNNIITNSTEKYKSLMNNPLMSKTLMAMFSIKDILAGTIGTVIPWLILLIIVGFIIIV